MGSGWCVVAVFCALAWAAAAQDAPAPAAAGPANLTAILEKGGQYTTLIRLLGSTSVGNQIENQLNTTSSEGLTVLAPTDNAFNNLKAGTLNDLSTQDQVNLIQFHILPKFYTLEALLTVSNPVRTQYSVDGLNFTGQSRDLNVSSGLVQTRLNNALRQQFPLAVYQLDQVLLPPSFYSPRPAPPPASTPATKSKTNSSSSADSPSDDQKSNRSPAGPTVPLGFLLALIASYFL